MYTKQMLSSAIALVLCAPLTLAKAQTAGVWDMLQEMGFRRISPEAPQTQGRVQQWPYVVVDTGQASCYDRDGAEITCLALVERFYGQDAQNVDNAASYKDNRDGTVTDNLTGLMWQQTPPEEKYSWSDAQGYCESLSLSDHTDWRTPSLKELFSISDFAAGWPYVDTRFFVLNSTPELKQLQYWSSNFYEVGTIHNGAASAFGVNHGTGHIKAYPAGSDETSTDGSEGLLPDGGVGAPTDGSEGLLPDGNVGTSLAAKYVRCVRGNVYGVNAFIDNGDGTITDNASGLMWTQDDSAAGFDWEGALALADEKNAEDYLGYNDWRLPNIRELQSIVDYSGSYPAIDAIYFNITDIDSYFWSSTSAYFSPDSPEYYYGWYVAFGYAVGPDSEDVHGAGAVRFDTKVVGGPAGEDPERIFNYVRLVRDAERQIHQAPSPGPF